MATIYFLLAVAAVGGAVTWLVRRSMKSGAEARSRRHTRPLHQRRMDGHSLTGAHVGHVPSHARDVWKSARINKAGGRAASVTGRSLTATHLRRDDEIDAEVPDSIVMNVVECAPEDLNLDQVKPPPKYLKR